MKQKIKTHGREKFAKNKRKIQLLIFVIKLFPIKFRKKIFNFIRYKNSIFIILMRYCIFCTLVQECGDNVLIGSNVEFKALEKMKVGNNVSIHNNCYLDASGGIEIGNNVSIAHDTSIISSNHTWENKDIPIKYNKLSYKKIKIEDDVWIGAKVIILQGVKIEKRVVIGAGAVVTKNIKSHSVAVGNPAIKIKNI